MLFKLLVKFIKPYWPLLLVVVVFQTLQSIASLYLPTLNADIINNGVAKGDTEYIIVTGGWMLLITLGQVVCTIVAVWFGARLAMIVGKNLRSAIFGKVGDFSEQEVSYFGAPSLITRTTNDVQQVQMLVLMTCTMLVAAPILAITGVVLAIRQDPQLSWLIAVAVPVLLIAVGLIIVRVVPLFQKMQKRIDKVNGVLREQLTGIRVVRAFVREPVEQDRFAQANREVTDVAIRAGRLFALMFPIVMLVLNVSSVAVLWFGSFQIQNGTLEIGTLTAFLSYLMQILMGVMMATFMAVLIPRAAVSGQRIQEVLTTDSSVVVTANPVASIVREGRVEFRDVSFSYPGAELPVLEHLDFVVEPGTTTAIIGSTGSGKTTLVNLLPRLFDAGGGEVLVDGVNVRDMDPEALWSAIGFIPQRPYLFTGTIASNLRYGRPDATDDELWAALEIAQGKDFVSRMPEGLESPITQGGTNVSGGQRQRLAIARALVIKPLIYVFDDAFSALDLRTDSMLRGALGKSTVGASKIIVAQRVSTIVSADQILVLEHGEIVARGTHDELMETSTTYAEIVNSQLTAEEAA